jgi:hypothetical protein
MFNFKSFNIWYKYILKHNLKSYINIVNIINKKMLRTQFNDYV